MRFSGRPSKPASKKPVRITIHVYLRSRAVFAISRLLWDGPLSLGWPALRWDGPLIEMARLLWDGPLPF